MEIYMSNDEIKIKVFKRDEELSMMKFLNGKKCERLITVCQSKSNDFSIFYWGQKND